MKAELQEYLGHVSNLTSMPPEQTQQFFQQLKTLEANIAEPDMHSFALYKLA